MKKLGLKSAEEKRVSKPVKVPKLELKKHVTVPKIATTKQIVNTTSTKPIITPRTMKNSRLLKPTSTFLQKKNSVQNLGPKESVKSKPIMPKLSI